MKKITKILLMFVLVVSCFAGVVAFAGCKEKTLTNIGLSKEIKTEYQLNEKLDLLDAKLVLTYSDNTQNELTISSDMISGFDTMSAGQKTLIITYQSKEVKVDYVVVEDFDTIMSKAVQNLLNATSCQVTEKTYRDSLGEELARYVRNVNYFKTTNSLNSESSWFELYDFANQRLYNSSSKNTTNGPKTIQELYGYAYQFLDINVLTAGSSSYEVSDKTRQINNGLYSLTYKLTQGTSTLNFTVVTDLNCNVQYLVAAENGITIRDYTYSYTNVPTLTWDVE